MKTKERFKKVAIALVMLVGMGVAFASCSEDAYYEDPVQPLPPEEITQPLPPNIEPH